MTFLASSTVTATGVIGSIDELGALDRDARSLERLAHVHQVVRARCRRPTPRRRPRGPRRRRRRRACISSSSSGAPALLDDDLALALELERDRTGRAEVAAGARERRADVGGRAVAVVGERLDVDRDAARAVALVDDLVVAAASAPAPNAFLIAASILSLGRRVDFAFVDGGRERRVVLGIRVPPVFAATVMMRESFENSAERFSSDAALRCFVVAHLECPDMVVPFAAARRR